MTTRPPSLPPGCSDCGARLPRKAWMAVQHDPSCIRLTPEWNAAQEVKKALRNLNIATEQVHDALARYWAIIEEKK